MDHQISVFFEVDDKMEAVHFLLFISCLNKMAKQIDSLGSGLFSELEEVLAKTGIPAPQLIRRNLLISSVGFGITLFGLYK